MATTSSSYSTSTSGNPGLAQLAEQLMEQQYSWGQQQFQQNDQLTDQVVGDLMQTYGQLSGLGNQMMNQYQTMFEPEYQSLVKDANNYSSQARIQQAMGAAESGVAQNFNGQRDAALTDLQEFGIDPSSGRYDQLDKSERVQQAAAQAGAGFQAEQATEATGRGLRSEALQLGSVMPSQATAAYNAASGAAQAGENAKLANSQEGINLQGSPIQWGDMGMQLKNSQSASRSQGGNSPSSSNQGNSQGRGMDALDEHETSGQADPNWAGNPGPNSDASGGGVGGIPAAGQIAVNDSGAGGNSTTAGGGQDASTADATYGGNDDSSGGGDSGSSDIGDSGDDESFAGGGAIPYSKSPSHGRVTDDVPAVINGKDPARLNAGEFVMPRHTVQWKGQEFFHKLIEQSKKRRGAATAKPEMKSAIPMSRSGESAHV